MEVLHLPPELRIDTVDLSLKAFLSLVMHGPEARGPVVVSIELMVASVELRCVAGWCCDQFKSKRMRTVQPHAF